MQLVQIQHITVEDEQESLRQAVLFLFHAEAQIHAEAEKKIAKLHRVRLALEERITSIEQAATPKSQNIRIHKAINQEKKKRYAVANHPEVRVVFPDWVGGTK